MIKNKAFAEKTLEQQFCSCMETALEIKTEFDYYKENGKLSAQKIEDFGGGTEINHLIMDLALEYEDKYCGTDEYEDAFIESVEKFAYTKLLETFSDVHWTIKGASPFVIKNNHFDTYEEAWDKAKEIAISKAESGSMGGCDPVTISIDKRFGIIRVGSDTYKITEEE